MSTNKNAAESQAAEGFAAGDWVPGAAKAIARWAYGYYNGNDCGSTDALKYWDGVGHQLPGPKWTIDVISQVLTGFAPTNQSQQLAAAQARIVELENVLVELNKQPGLIRQSGGACGASGVTAESHIKEIAAQCIEEMIDRKGWNVPDHYAISQARIASLNALVAFNEKTNEELLARVAVLEKALEAIINAHDELQALEDKCDCADDPAEEEKDACLDWVFLLADRKDHGRKLLSARSASGSQPSREKEGDK